MSAEWRRRKESLGAHGGYIERMIMDGWEAVTV